MFGLGDFSIAAVYSLCILSSLLCIIYGIVNWNKGGEPTQKEIKQEVDWDKKELEINEELNV